MVVDCGVALIGQDELASGQHPEMYYETAGAASPVSTTRAVVVAHRVLADAPTANDPEVSGGISVLKSAHKRPNGIVELSASWFAANAEQPRCRGMSGDQSAVDLRNRYRDSQEAAARSRKRRKAVDLSHSSTAARTPSRRRGQLL